VAVATCLDVMRQEWQRLTTSRKAGPHGGHPRADPPRTLAQDPPGERTGDAGPTSRMRVRLSPGDSQRGSPWRAPRPPSPSTAVNAAWCDARLRT